jgi:hypothetical protein
VGLKPSPAADEKPAEKSTSRRNLLAQEKCEQKSKAETARRQESRAGGTASVLEQNCSLGELTEYSWDKQILCRTNQQVSKKESVVAKRLGIWHGDRSEDPNKKWEIPALAQKEEINAPDKRWRNQRKWDRIKKHEQTGKLIGSDRCSQARRKNLWGRRLGARTRIEGWNSDQKSKSTDGKTTEM